MKTIAYIIQKEFLQIRRNRLMLPIIFIVPIIQMLILVNAATMEMKNISICIVDEDLSSTSRGVTGKFTYSPFFKVSGTCSNIKEAYTLVENGKAQMILHIPSHFEKNLIRDNHATIQLLFNAINGTVAGISQVYSQQIMANYNLEIIQKWVGANQLNKSQIQIIPAFWYNPDMNYKVYMVPAILVILVTIIGMLLASMNIVREKEMGTMEQINVTPIKKSHFIIGKLLPFWIIALFMLTFGLFIGKLIFNIPIVGNVGLLLCVACIYLLGVQGFGLLISNSANNQQQAMFMSFFFMLIFILMSGVFTPTESMPEWARMLNYLNPVAYFMKLIRMILLKGSGFMDIYPDLLLLFIYSTLMIVMATLRYRKVMT